MFNDHVCSGNRHGVVWVVVVVYVLPFCYPRSGPISIREEGEDQREELTCMNSHNKCQSC